MSRPTKLTVHDEEYNEVGTVDLEYECSFCEGMGKIVDWETDTVSPCPQQNADDEERCVQGVCLNDDGRAILEMLKRWQ